MDVLFTVLFWDRCGTIRSCSVVQLRENTCDPWRMAWDFWTFFSWQEVVFEVYYTSLKKASIFRHLYLIAFRTPTFTTPMAKLATLGGKQTCGFSWIWMNLEQTNLDISWRHKTPKTIKSSPSLTFTFSLNKKRNAFFSFWKWNPYQTKGDATRKPKPSINKTSQIWCNSPSWWKKYAGRRMSTGLRRKTSRQQIATHMGFLPWFFRFPVICLVRCTLFFLVNVCVCACWNL